MPWLTARTWSSPASTQRGLDRLDPADHVVEGLAAAVGVLGVIGVLGHPHRPAPQPLLLEAELAEAV